MNTNIIDYLTDVKGYKQIDIAKKMGVSTVQVSKWKKNRDIATKRAIELMKLADLWWESEDGRMMTSEYAILIKTKENELQWHKYFMDLNHHILDNNPTEIWHHSFEDLEDFIAETLLILNTAGFNVPTIAPTFPSDPKLMEALDLSDQETIMESRKFDELIRTYWITNYNLRMKSCEFESPALSRFYTLIPDFALYKIILEDKISLPFPDDPIKLHTYRNDFYLLLSELINDVELEINTGLEFDITFFDDLINLPKPILDERIRIIRDQLNLDNKTNDESDTFKELDKKLKNISITNIEKIISEAISEKLESEYSVKINTLDFDSSSFSSIYSDKAQISLEIKKDRFKSNSNNDQLSKAARKHSIIKKTKDAEDLERARQRSIKKRDDYLASKGKEI